MRRREFISLFGVVVAVAASLPRTTRAQNAVRTPRIGYLTLHPPGAEETAQAVACYNRLVRSSSPPSPTTQS
jgi:hypothetical protein